MHAFSWSGKGCGSGKRGKGWITEMVGDNKRMTRKCGCNILNPSLHSAY